jgi:hypothetical protein
VDFGPIGAALYRSISAEFLGPEWEDLYYVIVPTNREEHLYCEMQEGIHNTLAEYAANGEIVRASRIEPIGPWCVRWWERYDSGFRLEVQVGDESRN